MTGTSQRTVRSRTPALAPEPAFPFISVIVPVRNEAAFIRPTLIQLLEQDYAPDRFEILVADGRSTDATRAIVGELQKQHAHLKFLDNPRCWSSAGRNVAIRAARGELLVIVDGHCDLANRHYLRDLAEAFARSGADCVGRPQPLDVSTAAPLQRAIAAARASWLGHHPDSFIYSSAEGFVRPQSVGVAYRRSVFEAVGLFDEAFDACEDVEFNHRVAQAGMRCFFTPRVRVFYYPRSSLRGLLSQMIRYGRGRVRLLRKHPDTFTVPGFAPAAFLLGMGIGPMLAQVLPPLAAAYVGAVGAYLLTVLLTSLALAVKARQPRWVVWLPLVFGVIHVGAGVGILHEVLTGLWHRPESQTPPVPQVSGE